MPISDGDENSRKDVSCLLKKPWGHEFEIFTQNPNFRSIICCSPRYRFSISLNITA
jgi:hypothetical protein